MSTDNADCADWEAYEEPDRWAFYAAKGDAWIGPECRLGDERWAFVGFLFRLPQCSAEEQEKPHRREWGYVVGKLRKHGPVICYADGQSYLDDQREMDGERVHATHARMRNISKGAERRRTT